MRRLRSAFALFAISASSCGAATAQGIPGNDHSYGAGASPDGRYVVFTSNATNLVPRDTNGQPDVFVFDRQAGTVVRASVDPRGLQANGISEGGTVSADGRYVAFASTADNLPPAAGGPWIKDLLTGALERLDTITGLLQFTFPVVSDDGDVVAWDRRNQLRIRVRSTGTTIAVPPTPAPPDTSRDWAPTLSGNGQFLAFATKLDGLVPGDANGFADIVRYDRIANTYAMVSSGGTPANGPSGGIELSTAYRRIAISGNGSRIVFYSEATNLDSSDAVALGGLYVRDMAQAQPRKIARCLGSCTQEFYAVAISGDGQWVSFYAPRVWVDPQSETQQREGYYRYFVSDGILEFVAGNEPGAVTVALAFASSAVSNGGGQLVLQTNGVSGGIPDNGPFADVLLIAGATTTLASRAARGTLADGSSRQPALSADGRHVAFASYATNLGPADSNRDRDVYVRDIASGTIVLGSAAADGTPGNRESRNPALSDDGRFLAFISGATNLTPDDGNGPSPDVFLKDLSNGSIQRISRSPANTGGGGVFVAAGPALSASGRYVAFTSGANDLVAGDFDGIDVYLRDTQTNTTIKANPTFDGLPPEDFCSPCDGHRLSLSDDGNLLAFQSRAQNQIAGLDDEVEPDVFVFNRTTGTIELVSRASGIVGLEGDCRSSAPSISGDGRWVAFWSCASNLAPGFVGPAVYLRDRLLQTTRRVARSPEVIGLPGTEPGPQISRDGSRVALVSFARALVAGDTNQLPDVFVWTRATDRIERASLSAAWTQADGASYTYDLVEGVPRFFGLSISRDGARIAVSAAAQNLVARDDNAADDVFVFERANQAVLRASAAPVVPADDDRTAPAASADARYTVAVRTDRDGALGGGGPGAKGIGNKWSQITRFDWNAGTEIPIDVGTGGLAANGDSRFPSSSANGRVVAFASDADNLGAAPDTNGASDVFVRDTAAGTTVNVTQGANGANDRSAAAMITGNKFSVAFETHATNLGPAPDTNGVQDVIVATEGAPNEVVSVATGGAAANGPSGEPAISADGRFVGFTSLGDNLVPADTNGAADVFVRDVANDTTTLVSVAFSGGGKPNGASGAAQIVSIGAGASDWIAAFESEANDIVANDLNADTDIFVRTGAGANELISVGIGGAPANGKSFGASLSPDGRYVSFTSAASNLVPGDTNDAADVFLYDRVADTTTRISVSSANAQADAFALRASLGLDALGAPLVVFDSAAGNLAPNDDDDAFDLFRRTAQGVTEIADPDVVFRDGFE